SMALAPLRMKGVRSVGPTEVVRRYVEAWNKHDPAAIAALFIEGGTYTDPLVPRGVSGEALARYAQGFFVSFMDGTFDIEGISVANDGKVILEWRMRGTNTGPLLG